MIVKTDCVYFRGDVPCKHHKKHGVHCSECSYYKPILKRILIIKLGAIGDVIRTTPLLRKLREKYNEVEISWLTYFPDVLTSSYVDNILNVSIENIEWLKCNKFTWVINLDKDKLAISLLTQIKAEKKSGFTMNNLGKCVPIGSAEEKHKWITGVWDDANKINKKNYMEEIFEICGFIFDGEEYIVRDTITKEIGWNIDYSKKIVGLNTGCGGRWKSRLWSNEYWIELAERLINDGFEVILLGGKQEDEKNKEIADKSKAKYLGHYNLEIFINLVHQVDLVVSAVTMTMHLAIGLKKKLVLFNNIFNRNEFYLYNRGVILEPEMECDCFFLPECKNNCMTTLSVDNVYRNIIKLL